MCNCSLYSCLDRLKNAVEGDSKGNLAVRTKEVLGPLLTHVPDKPIVPQPHFLEAPEQLELPY